MRKVEIRLKDDDTPFLNMLFVIEDKDRFVCTNLDGKILVYPKKEYDFRFLDPPEEEAITKKDYMDLFDNLVEHKERIQNLKQRVEKLENKYYFLDQSIPSPDEVIEHMESVSGIYPIMQGEPEHTCHYLDSLDQPYPHRCTICGKEEHPYPKEKKDYLFDYDGVIAAFRSAVEKDRRHGTGYLKESTFAQELLHTPIVQLPPTFTRNEVEKAIDAALTSIYMFGVPRLKCAILFELDKVKDGK